MRVHLSSDGKLVSASTYNLNFPITTNIYQPGSGIGTLLTTVAGWGVDWLDSSRLYANLYVPSGSLVAYAGAVLYDAHGAVLAQPALPESDSLQPLTSDLVYSPTLNGIFSLSGGNQVWASADPPPPYQPGLATLGGPQVVFQSGSFVLVQPH